MKIKYLKWYDILIITLILFGSAIYNSTVTYFTTDAAILAQGTEFTTADDIYAIITQSIELLICGIYLFFRKFDFSQWKFKITLNTTALAIGLFFIFGACMDAINIMTTGFYWVPEYLKYNTPILSALSDVNLPLVIFSLLNGFYEEIFFLGICINVEPKYKNIAFIYSLIIRFSFHTYQGLIPALGIGFILGIIYYYFYTKKTDNLYPYILSHAFADVFGLSLLHFL